MTTQTLPSRSAPEQRNGRTATTGAPATGSVPFPDPVEIDASTMERAARVIRVLGHPLRLRLLEVLERGEHHVTDLVNASGASQALVSQHLAILRAEAVVGARRDGLRIFYRITEPKVHRILACIRECDLPEVGDGSVTPVLGLTDNG